MTRNTQNAIPVVEQVAIKTEIAVRRRDGTVTTFDPERIRNAIEEAFRADREIPKNADTDPFSAREIKQISAEVIDSILLSCANKEQIDIEEIQDAVEILLMQHGHYSVARRYIVYREEHAKKRARENTNLKNTGLKKKNLVKESPLGKRQTQKQVRRPVAKAPTAPAGGWAWQHYLSACTNHWMPAEIPTQQDTEFWKSDSLGEAERSLILKVLSSLAGTANLLADNIVFSVYTLVRNPAAKKFLLHQGSDEAKHYHAVKHIIESFTMDADDVINSAEELVSFRDKNNFLLSHTLVTREQDGTAHTPENAQALIKNLFASYIVMEGIFIQSSCAMLLSFEQQNRMQGMVQELRYLLRDVSTHLDFGIDLINGIKAENPEAWTSELRDEMRTMIRQALDHEYLFASNCLGNDALGISADAVSDYTRYIADRLMERIGIPSEYGSENPFGWMGNASSDAKKKTEADEEPGVEQSASTLIW